MLITFEGGEGCGKTTQAEMLAARLRDAGRAVTLVREPGGTPLGESLRQTLLHGHRALTPQAELLLFLAARAELVETVIRPALLEGQAVVCDRFSDSTLAYQGYGRGLEVGSVRSLDRWATGGLRPDLTVLLDIPVEAGRRRKHAEDDAFQRESDAFHGRVREGYLYLAASEPDRWLVLDGTLPAEALAGRVWERVRGVLEAT